MFSTFITHHRNLALKAAMYTGISILASQGSYASEQCFVQVLEQESVQKQTVLEQEYKALFLDDWQKLVLEGKNEEAVKLALLTEQDCIQAERKDYFKRNTALSNRLYRLSQHRSYLQPNERFSPSYFRMYHANPERLIETHTNAIAALTKELEYQQKVLAQLVEKKQSAPKKRDLLKAEIDDQFKAFKELREAIIAATQDQEIVAIVNEVDAHAASIRQMIAEASPQQFGDEALVKKIEDIGSKMWERLNAPAWQQKRSALQKEFQALGDCDAATQLITLDYDMERFFRAPLGCASKCEEWFKTDPESSLSSWEEGELSDRQLHLEDLRRDTVEQISQQLRKIEFIKANPEFFQIQNRSRAAILGIADVGEWHVKKASRKLGDDVIVAVIDSYDARKQTSNILNKAVNPDFVGGGHNFVVNEGEIKDHGIGVASIIVSDEIDKQYEDCGLTVGVAPGARFEMMDTCSISLQYKLEKERGQLHWPEHIQWTAPKMAEALSEFCRTGLITELGFSRSMIGENPLLGTKAKIINFSGVHSQLKRDSRQPLSYFEGLYDFPILVELIKSRLFVQSLGNDGVDVSSTNELRLLKAFAMCEDISPNYLAVTNLMQDGVTLSPSSNIPGSNPFLQDRTLSAPGTDLTTAVLTGDTQSSAYEVKSGTSFSAPHVSGVAAVVLSNHPTMTPAQLSQCLLDSATPLLMTAEGVTVELTDITACELRRAFEQDVDAESILIGGQRVHVEDWLRGLECFGQGRVHLENALKLADEMNVDLT